MCAVLRGVYVIFALPARCLCAVQLLAQRSKYYAADVDHTITWRLQDTQRGWDRRTRRRTFCNFQPLMLASRVIGSSVGPYSWR